MGDVDRIELKILTGIDGGYTVECRTAYGTEVAMHFPSLHEALDRGISWLRETRERA